MEESIVMKQKKIFKTLEDMEGDKIDVRVSILTLLDLDHYLVFI